MLSEIKRLIKFKMMSCSNAIFLKSSVFLRELKRSSGNRQTQELIFQKKLNGLNSCKTNVNFKTLYR